MININNCLSNNDIAWIVSVAHKDDHMLLKWIIWVFCLVCISNNGDIVLNFRKIFNPKIYHNQCYNRSILGKNYNWTHQMFSIKIILRYQLLPFKNCRHWADFIILEMLWWRFWKQQSGEFCIGCNWIPCFCIRYRNAAITEHGSLSRDAMFCSSRIVHPYRRNQPWFQVYTSVCPRGARRENLSWLCQCIFILWGILWTASSSECPIGYCIVYLLKSTLKNRKC